MRRWARTAGALATAAVVVGGQGLLAGCGGDDEADLEVGEVEVVGSGEERKVTLPGTYEVGQTSGMESTVELDLSISAAGVSQDASTGLVMTTTREVTEVGSGEITVEETVEDIQVTGDEEVRPDVEAEVEPMIGTVIVSRHEENGRRIGEPTTESGDPLPEQLQQQQAQLVFPTEPVGVGARWRVGNVLDSGGTTFEFVQEYELVELTEDGYVIELTADDTLDVSEEGTDISGPITLEGEVRGQLGNPLVVDTQFDLDFDGDIDAEGESGSMSMQVAVEQLSAEA